MLFVCITGAASLFVTTFVVKRAIVLFDENSPPPVPVSQKLADRMTTILNAEILAYLSVPITATLMSRGVGYADWFPWQAGAAASLLALGGLGYKYVKEVLDMMAAD